MGLEKLKVEAELGNAQGWWRTPGISRRMRSISMQSWRVGVLLKKDVDEVYMNKMELESHREGLTDEINVLRQPAT